MHSRILLIIATILFNCCIASEAPVAAAEPASVNTHPPAPICYFVPPAGWEIAKLANPSPFIQIGFIGKGSTSFRPSINLAFEDDAVNLKEYVKSVKKIHLSDPNTKCRDLGKFNMRAGEGHLLDITVSASHGEIKQYQALFVKDNRAYILTIAVLKEDLPQFQSAMIQSLQTLNLIPDLYAPLDEKQKAELRDFFARLENGDVSLESKKKQLERMQQTLAEKFAQIGPHWHYLVLSEGVSRINNP